jgi:hypothetical protein
MYFEPFRNFYRALADDEMRLIHVYDGGDIPAGSYGLLEQYCANPACDCRRVIFAVLCRETVSVDATISYSWEDRSFHKQMWEWASEEELDKMTRPSLEPTGPQAAHAAALRDFVAEFVLIDPEYVERLKRHYKMFKAHIRPVPTSRRAGQVRPGKTRHRRRR